MIVAKTESAARLTRLEQHGECPQPWAVAREILHSGLHPGMQCHASRAPGRQPISGASRSIR